MLEDAAADLEPPERLLLVLRHQLAVARHVGGKYRRQLSLHIGATAAENMGAQPPANVPDGLARRLARLQKIES